MFTSYIKSLNDMVFSTSESPEEQPSTGVLGRIGGWFSPWRGKGPKTSSENAFSTGDLTFKSEGEEESEEYVTAQTGEQQWEDENPKPKPVFRDVFLCEEEDATQSAHRDGSVVSSAEAGAGGPEKEELAVCREQRKGQGKRREERRSGASAFGIPEENATHLTHLSTSCKQGVAWDFDQAHTQSQTQRRAQAQTGKKLHVYLEETSVIHCGQDSNTEQDVFRTTVTKSLHVLPKFKSSSGVDLEEKRTHVSSAADPQFSHSAPEEASLKSNKDSLSESDCDKDQTDTNSMGRKNASRRRSRKNSQGDGGNVPQEKSPPNAQPAAESTTSLTRPQGEGSDAPVCVESADSSSKLSPTSQASPGGGKSQTSCPDTVKELDNFQESNSETAASQACAVDSLTEMDEDRFFKVERKTETPESKRRSIKVSRSEVKIFPKYVPFKPKQASGENTQDTGKTEADGSLQGPKKATGDPKPVVGRIADRINAFERQQLVGDQKQTFQAPRSADVSPSRIATERLKSDFAVSDLRSRSVERYGISSSGSTSPAREKPMTIKERAKKFDEQSVLEAKGALPQIPGISQQPSSSVKDAMSKTKKLDIQGKLDTNQQTQTKAASDTNLKAGGQDETAGRVEICTSKAQATELKGKETMAPESDKTNTVVEEQSDSAELSPHLKTPSRTGSRSKRRKSKEPTSPISPNNQNKPECLTNKPEVTATKQEQVDITEETVCASKQPTEKDLLPSHGAQENASSKQPPSDAKQKTFKKESEVPDRPKKKVDTSSEQKNIDKPADGQEGLPELSVNRDEPDTAACSSETKKPIDKGTVILPQKEEKAEGHSDAFTREEKNACENNRETSASSPLAVPSIEKSPAGKQDSRIESPKLDKELSMQLESKSNEQGRKPSKKETEQAQQSQNKDTEIQAETKRVDESEKSGSEKTNLTAGADKENTPKFLSSDENTSKGKVLESGLSISGKVGSFVRDDERKKAEKNKEMQPGEDITKSEANQPELASLTSVKPQESSKLLVKTKHIDRVFDTHTEKVPASAVVKSNEAMSGSKNDKEPWKVKTATNVPPELQKQSSERPGAKTERPVIGPKPQPKSVSVEKTQNSLDDSCAHGSNDAVFSSIKPVTKAATAVEKVTVKVNNNTPVLKPEQSDPSNKEKSQYSVKEGSPLSVSESVNTEGVKNDDGKSTVMKPAPSEVKVPGDIAKLTPIQPQPGESKNKESKSNATTDKDAQKPPATTASSSSLKEVKESAKETGNKLTPIANGDISANLQVQTVKEEPIINKPSQTSTPVSPEAKKPSPDSTQRSSMKKLHLPRALAKDDSSKWQDAPSSWLDVDCPKQKVKTQEPKLTSSGSESNLLDTPDLDDDDFITRIKNLCAPFSLPPRKHNPLGSAQPPFAMPAIREDRFEKVFDPEEFTIGLRKKTQYGIDTSHSLLSKLQTTDTKSSIKPARASIADRCLLLGSMDAHSRLRDKTTANSEEGVKDETDDQIKVKSRLEGSCVLSSLTSSSIRGKRNGVQALAEGTGSGNVSPSESPQVSPPPFSQAPPPSPTSSAPFKLTLAKQGEEEAQSAEVVVTDSGPPLPSFNDLKLPDYLQKYLPQDPVKPVQSARGQDQVKPELTGKMTTPASLAGADVAVKPGPTLPEKVPPRFPGISPTVHSAVPELQQPPAPPQGILRNNAPTVKRGFHKRPGKMVLFEKAQFGGQAYEINRDLADATSLQLSPLISVKVVRGCWLLYEKPGFQGRTIALEEGGTELANMWEEPGSEKDPESSPPMLIGSIRLAVGDYSIPHIDLFTEPEGHGRVTPYHDDTIETGSFGIPLSTASIQVHSGVWLVFSDPGFQGMIAVLERGVYPFPEAWGFPSPFVGSLRPLKMGFFKVENPDEVKAVVYEKPGFEGCSSEIDSDVFSFCDGEGDASTYAASSNKLKAVGSLKITGGFWVGYSQPGFEGQQFILEEGEYLDCNDWGGSEILSLRPILSDFMTPHVKMFSDRDFGKLGVDIDLSVPVINMDDTGYGLKTQSIDVISGVWVVFEEPGFCGEPYVLEKGLYGSPEDWGAQQHRVGSTMPVLLDDFENTSKFKVQLFSNPGFQGSVLTLEDSIASPQDAFSVASCKVLAGSWLAFEGKDFTGKVYVLEEGSYPDLRAMGCMSANASILSLQPVGFEFSLPSITLFERCDLRGKRVVLTDGSVNLPFTGGCGRVQSVLVEGGIWVLYEGINYRGAQILLKPGEILNWQKFSSWKKIGSLRPLTQKQVHFRLRNKHTGLMMSVSGELSDVKLMRIQEEEETHGFEQIWFYHNGHLHCKMLEECCLSPIGSVTMAGSRLGLSPATADQTQRWSITPEGFIRYTHTSDLVLEIKGGHHYDKNQVILNTPDPHKPQQRWTVEIL